jgi:hypothetical protein
MGLSGLYSPECVEGEFSEVRKDLLRNVCSDVWETVAL